MLTLWSCNTNISNLISCSNLLFTVLDYVIVFLSFSSDYRLVRLQISSSETEATYTLQVNKFLARSNSTKTHCTWKIALNSYFKIEFAIIHINIGKGKHAKIFSLRQSGILLRGLDSSVYNCTKVYNLPHFALPLCKQKHLTELIQ